MANRPEYRLFVSSPGDVPEERARAGRVIERLATEFADQVTLSPVLWERRTYSALKDFQSQIELTASCQLVIGVLWARIGSPLAPDLYRRPDGSAYESGTVFEIETALEQGRRHGVPDVVVFEKRASIPVDPRAPQPDLQEQLGLLRGVLQRWQRTPKGHFKAAFNSFRMPDEFESRLEQHLREWLAGRGHVPHAPRWDIAKQGSPYPRLEPYNADRRLVFLGREAAGARCLELLRQTAGRNCAFLLILGGSGAGKSSLARAGVLPDLTLPGTLPGVDGWRSATLRPGQDPLANLAASLFAALPELAEGENPTPEKWASAVAAHAATAAGSVTAALHRSGQAVKPAQQLRLALLVDQLEEALDAAGRVGFLAALDVLARCGHVSVLTTLRSDHYPSTQAEPLLQLKQDGAQYDLPPAGPAEFDAIIRGSASAAGLMYQRRADGSGDLGDTLQAALGNASALPLLQMALAELFEERDQTTDTLTFAAYNDMDGLEGAIERRAEAVFGVVDPQAQAMLPGLLLDLAGGVTAADQVVSRPVVIKQLDRSPAAARLRKVLVDGSLLLTEGETVRVTHDALLRFWPRAKTLLDPTRIRAKARIEDLLPDWLNAKQRAGRKARRHLLPAGPQLETGIDLQRYYKTALSPDLETYITASLRADRWRRWRLGIAAVCAGILLVGLTTYAFYSAYEAREQRGAAVAEAALATKQLGKTYVALGDSKLQDYPYEAALYARAAHKLEGDDDLDAVGLLRKAVLKNLQYAMLAPNDTSPRGGDLYLALYAPAIFATDLDVSVVLIPREATPFDPASKGRRPRELILKDAWTGAELSARTLDSDEDFVAPERATWDLVATTAGKSPYRLRIFDLSTRSISKPVIDQDHVVQYATNDGYWPAAVLGNDGNVQFYAKAGAAPIKLGSWPNATRIFLGSKGERLGLLERDKVEVYKIGASRLTGEIGAAALPDNILSASDVELIWGPSADAVILYAIESPKNTDRNDKNTDRNEHSLTLVNLKDGHAGPFWRGARGERAPKPLALDNGTRLVIVDEPYVGGSIPQLKMLAIDWSADALARGDVIAWERILPFDRGLASQMSITSVDSDAAGKIVVGAMSFDSSEMISSHLATTTGVTQLWTVPGRGTSQGNSPFVDQRMPRDGELKWGPETEMARSPIRRVAVDATGQRVALYDGDGIVHLFSLNRDRISSIADQHSANVSEATVRTYYNEHDVRDYDAMTGASHRRGLLSIANDALLKEQDGVQSKLLLPSNIDAVAIDDGWSDDPWLVVIAGGEGYLIDQQKFKIIGTFLPSSDSNQLVNTLRSAWAFNKSRSEDDEPLRTKIKQVGAQWVLCTQEEIGEIISCWKIGGVSEGKLLIHKLLTTPNRSGKFLGQSFTFGGGDELFAETIEVPKGTLGWKYHLERYELKDGARRVLENGPTSRVRTIVGYGRDDHNAWLAIDLGGDALGLCRVDEQGGCVWTTLNGFSRVAYTTRTENGELVFMVLGSDAEHPVAALARASDGKLLWKSAEPVAGVAPPVSSTNSSWRIANPGVWKRICREVLLGGDPDLFETATAMPSMINQGMEQLQDEQRVHNVNPLLGRWALLVAALRSLGDRVLNSLGGLKVN